MDRQAVIRELMRKAEAGEAEAGYCANATDSHPWKPGSAAPPPTGIFLKKTTERCIVERHSAPLRHSHRGWTCLRSEAWGCEVGGKCWTHIHRPEDRINAFVCLRDDDEFAGKWMVVYLSY